MMMIWVCIDWREYVADTGVRTVGAHRLLTTTALQGLYYYPHFTLQKTEAS